jgi:hypothetical protein
VAEAGSLAEAPAARRSPDRSLLYIGLGIVAIAIAAVVAVVLLANRAPASYPAGSPEAAFQGYLQAFERGDYAASYASFSKAIRDSTSESEYRTAVGQYGIYDGVQGSRVLFDRTSGSGDRVVLHLIVEQYSGGGPFGGGEVYRSSRQISMVREDGTWKIDQALVWVDPGPFPGPVKG